MCKAPAHVGRRTPRAYERMRSFEIFVEPAPSSPAAPRDAAPSSALRRTRSAESVEEVLDVFVNGANVTARVEERNAVCVLRDLALAVAELASAPHGKRIVRFYDDAWELAIERLGAQAALSVYRAGGHPEVVVHDRPVIFEEVRDSVREAIRNAAERRSLESPVARELRDAGARLDAPILTSELPVDEPTAVDVPHDSDAAISFATAFRLRQRHLTEGEASVERADLHALLFRGRLEAQVRGRAVDLGDCHPFLFAERLLELSAVALDAWERGQPCNTRLEGGQIVVGVRVDRDGKAALVLGPMQASSRRAAPTTRALFTFPALAVVDLAEAALSFGRALVRSLLRRDRAQSMNLRLSAFRRQLRSTSEQLRDARKQDAKINDAPESYRAFVERPHGRGVTVASAPPARTTRLRYTERWRALVPGIDLRGSFLCGDRLVLGAAAETFCLHRTTGQLAWRIPTGRATSVMTPMGLARIAPDGAVTVHDLGSGEASLRSWIAPRVGGAPSGAVVSAPGLPRLLVVSEGERHLAALDLVSGEARWRYGAAKQGTFRLKRSGKLLYVTTGDSSLTALDVQSGAIVWRVRDRLKFRSAPTIDHDVLFAVAGGSRSAATLHAIDPFSGVSHWATKIDASASSGCTVEGTPLSTGDVVVVAVRDRRGLVMHAFDRATGASKWTTEGAIAPYGTSWLAIDELLIGNGPDGALVGLDVTAGTVRYRNALGSPLEGDSPRRLEPILRNGALFVPHADVHVVRPHDGSTLGVVGPCDAIPDLLRVDERGDVYVAEESGHVVSFGAGPRLSLVSPA